MSAMLSTIQAQQYNFSLHLKKRKGVICRALCQPNSANHSFRFIVILSIFGREKFHPYDSKRIICRDSIIVQSLANMNQERTYKGQTNLCSALAIKGSLIRKVLPTPRTLSTSIIPPCISIILLTIAKPRPVPPV